MLKSTTHSGGRYIGRAYKIDRAELFDAAKHVNSDGTLLENVFQQKAAPNADCDGSKFLFLYPKGKKLTSKQLEELKAQSAKHFISDNKKQFALVKGTCVAQDCLLNIIAGSNSHNATPTVPHGRVICNRLTSKNSCMFCCCLLGCLVAFRFVFLFHFIAMVVAVAAVSSFVCFANSHCIFGLLHFHLVFLIRLLCCCCLLARFVLLCFVLFIYIFRCCFNSCRVYSFAQGVPWQRQYDVH